MTVVLLAWLAASTITAVFWCLVLMGARRGECLQRPSYAPLPSGAVPQPRTEVPAVRTPVRG